MILEVIIFIIVLIPVVIFVIVRRKGELRTNFSKVLLQIAGNFLLVFGVLMLFPAFYVLFHGKDGGMKIVLLSVSLLFVFGGYLLSNWAGKRPKRE
jgi:predicted Na+-dependent transporter